MNSFRGLRGRLSISLILLLLASFWTVQAAAETGSGPGGRKVIEGVGGFPLDRDSGSMCLHALLSCLKATGNPSVYYNLVGFSRSAFKFVYDSTEAYEPLRDLYPVDVLRQAAVAEGYPESRWETNKSINTVKSLIKQEIDSGRPVIAPFLRNDAYHGFFVITGYDYEQEIFYLQGALDLDSGYVSVPIPDYWDGPTASPAGWARNPSIRARPEEGRAGKEGSPGAGVGRDGHRALQGRVRWSTVPSPASSSTWLRRARTRPDTASPPLIFCPGTSSRRLFS